MRTKIGLVQAESRPRSDQAKKWAGDRPAATGVPGQRLGPSVDSHPSVGPVQGCGGRHLPSACMWLPVILHTQALSQRSRGTVREAERVLLVRLFVFLLKGEP